MNSLPLSVIDTFRDTAKNHPLWNHSFLNRCRTERLTLPEVRVLAMQMYQFCNVFNRILASIMARCPDAEAQQVILENLIDEMGEGDPSAAHPELFRRFTRALGIEDEVLAKTPPEPETLQLIETYLNLPYQFGYLAALGAVCFASEGIVGTLYTQLQQGIIGATELPEDALTFFNVHIYVDDGHAAHLAALLEPRITSAQQVREIETAIVRSLDARVRFFDGIQRRTAQMTDQNLLCQV
jgi:pyrroloquinoline-quinone synthase